MKQHEHLVVHFINLGCTISVFDGEEIQEKKSDNVRKIMEAIESVDESAITIYDEEERIGMAILVLSSDENTVCDHSDKKAFHDWSDEWGKYEEES